MGLEKLSIILDNRQSTFFPGQIISGKIAVTVKSEPIHLKGNQL